MSKVICLFSFFAVLLQVINAQYFQYPGLGNGNGGINQANNFAGNNLAANNLAVTNLEVEASGIAASNLAANNLAANNMIASNYAANNMAYGGNQAVLNSAGLPSNIEYGGQGQGQLAIIGEMPVSGSTGVSGYVPVYGLVQFEGSIPANGQVTIYGNTASSCSCNNLAY